jgi:hypothetical protein
MRNKTADKKTEDIREVGGEVTHDVHQGRQACLKKEVMSEEDERE